MSNIVDLRITKFNANISALVHSESIPRNGKIEIYEGGILELICSAAGRPKPEIHWFQDGRRIQSQKSISNAYITVEGETSILQLKNVNSLNSGSYACRVENINGHIRKWMTLIVKKPEKKNDNLDSVNNELFPFRNSTSNFRICQANYCQTGACFFDKTKVKCSCFPATQVKSQTEMNANINISAERFLANKCNQVGCYSFNDQIFTIFETILVCLVTMLLFGIMFFLWHNKRKSCGSRRMGSFTKTTQVNLIGTVKVRDASIDTNTDMVEIFPERLFHIPIDRIMTIGCCSHQIEEKTCNNNFQPDLYSKSIFSQPLKYPNAKYKANNLNCNSLYRSLWPDINYEESSLSYEDTQPLNQIRLGFHNERSPRDTISTFSDTGYSNSLKMNSELLPQTEIPLTSVEFA